MRALLLSLLVLLPTGALAHTGHAEGLVFEGILHPLGGLDHALAMVAVGLLAAQSGGRALWGLPVAFVAAMLVGGVAGAAGLAVVAVEPLILASVLLLGVAVALALRLPLGVMLAAVALFGAAHGWAHGAEGPTTGLAAYALGFVTATAALHGAGIALGLLLQGTSVRYAGGAAALAGLALAVA